jgi:hypothetical protein
MPNEPKDPKAPPMDEPSAARIQRDKAMKRIADEAAGKARKTSRRNDQRQGTFPRGGPSGMA